MEAQEQYKITKCREMVDYSCEVLNSISVKDLHLVESVDLSSTPDYFSVTVYFKGGVDNNEQETNV